MALLHRRAFRHKEVTPLLIESTCAFCGARIGISQNVGILAFVEALHSCPVYLEFLETLPRPDDSSIDPAAA